MSAVSIRGISKRFGRKKQIFEDFSLDLPSGRIIGLLGENGIGKTTLLKMIADLAKPYKGEILIDSLPISRNTRDKVSFLLEPENFEDFMTVGHAIDHHSDFFPDFNLAKAEEMASSFGLDKRDKITKLSKGQKARVCLMLCLSRSVPLYLLDEPMSGFDPKFKRDMVASILSYVEEGQTLVISSHLLRDLETVFDDIVILLHNEAVVASADDIRAQGKSIEEFYLEVVDR